MAKALIAYVSVDGHTEKLAEFMAEGFRMKGFQVALKKVSQLKNPEDFEGFDAYLFGCPTYHKDMTQNMKTFLFTAKKAGLEGKVGGAFGTSTHSGEAAPMIFETMEHVYKMKMTSLGALNVVEGLVDGDAGMKAGHDYARAIAEMVE